MVSTSNPDLSLKLILVGHPAAGKTSLLKRIVDSTFDQVSCTVGMDFRATGRMVCGLRTKVELWDTYVADGYGKPCCSSYYGSNSYTIAAADAVVLCYGMDQAEPAKLLEGWLTKLKEIELKAIYVVGCKSDLAPGKDREVAEWASSRSISHFQTSAKTG